MRIFLLARPKTANEIIDIKFLILKEIKMVFRTWNIHEKAIIQ